MYLKSAINLLLFYKRLTKINFALYFCSVYQQTGYSDNIEVNTWTAAIANTRSRTKIIAAVASLTAIILFFPHFFLYIEQRQNGILLDDWVLNRLNPRDFSMPVFVIIWSATGLFIYRSVTNPALFLDVVFSLILLCIARMASIYLVQLEPPAQLIKLTDPLTSLTYGGRGMFMTKDLFFSGHTSNMLLLALCFQKKSDKILCVAATILIGSMVLIQHVHYTIDVVGAIVFTSMLVPIGKKLAEL